MNRFDSARLTYSAAGAFIAVWSFAASAFAGLRVGAATEKITPPLGMALAGYYHARAADGVLDDLMAHALVLDDGTTRAALVTLDLISAPRTLVEAIRAEIDKNGAVAGASTMISATHAHTGPVIPDRVLGAAEDPARPRPTPGSPQARYLEALPRVIAAAVKKAAEALEPVVVSAISARCEGVAYNRRFYLRDGTVAWNPGKKNPETMRPAGATDPEVQAVFFEPPHDASKHVPALAIFANFSMHPDTVGGTKFSADYPGVLARRLADYHGPTCTVLYGNGACGNLNHIDTAWPRQQQGPAETARIGQLIAAAIFQGEKNVKPVVGGPLQVKSLTVPLRVPMITEATAERARDVLAHSDDTTRTGFMELVRARRALELFERDGRPFDAEVQVISLGTDLAWVGLPGELFVELGLALKKRSPFPRTIVVSLANGNPGYIPDRRSYAEGNYEPESSRVVPGSGEELVDAAVQLLQALHAPPSR